MRPLKSVARNIANQRGEDKTSPLSLSGLEGNAEGNATHYCSLLLLFCYMGHTKKPIIWVFFQT